MTEYTVTDLKKAIKTTLDRKYEPYTFSPRPREVFSVAEAIFREEISIEQFGDYSTEVSIAQVNEDGENYYEVFKVLKVTYTAYKKEPITVFFKVYGYYRSHDGSYYEGWKFVEPAVKTVEVFE